MAQSRSRQGGGKKTTSGRASSGRARSSGSRAPSARSQKPASRRAQRRAQTPDLLPSVLLAGLGLLCVAMVLVPGQNIWRAMRGVYFGLFGVIAYLVGPFLLYLAYLLASGYRVGRFAGKVALMAALCAGVPVVFSKVSTSDANAWEIIKMLYMRGQTGFWEGGVLGAPIGGTLLALFGRPASNVIMLLVFALGLMVFFAVTPADVVQFVDGQYRKLQAARSEREAGYDTPLFGETPQEESLEELTGTLPGDPARRRPAYDVIADTGSLPGGQAQPAPRAAAAPAPHSAAARASFDVDLGPGAEQGALQQAIDHDPLQRIEIGPGGTFGLDPLSHLSDPQRYHAPKEEPAPAPAPAPQEDFELTLQPEPAQQAPAGDELDALIHRAVSGHAPYDAEGTAGLAEEEETQGFSVPLQTSADFATPLVPVADAPEPPAAPQPAPERVRGDTRVLTQEELRAAMGGAAIPTLGGSFDVAQAAGEAWQAGKPLSDLLDAQPTGTEQSFAVPQGGEAARLQVSSSVGNSSGAPVHTPPQAAKAAIDLAAAQKEPPKPYCYPSLNLFNATSPEDEAGAAREMKRNADTLVKTLESFGVKTKILDICRGPSVTRYELQPQAGIKVSRITSLADDIALNLATAGVRIEAPIPGKPAVGIEVPNKIRSTVNIRSVFEAQNYINMRSPLTMALGKDIAGTAQVADLCKMPHLLIAGSTGSGKSVCVNSIIISFLFRSGPEDVKLILIDPKVVELAEYNGIPHLLMPVVTEPRKAAGALGASVAEMERRYKLFAENNVREIKAYNRLAAQAGLEHLPYIAIVIDELADLMMVAGKEVEDYICRIAQKARAAGIHLIVATQRPSVDVITGLIKANIPSRIAFAVSSQIDSRTILDASGAEKLLGNGDMLFLPVGASKPVRVQGTFVTDEEISAVLSFIKSTSSAQYDEEMIAEMERRAVAEKGSKKGEDDAEGGALDPMFEQAVECVIEAGQASTSLLQRRCKLGYARAARIMDQMEQEKVIGPYEGAKPRAVLVTRAQWQERKLNGQYEEN